MTYNAMRELVYKVTKISTLEFNVIMQVKYKLDINAPAVLLMDDDDSNFFAVDLRYM